MRSDYTFGINKRSVELTSLIQKYAKSGNRVGIFGVHKKCNGQSVLF